MLLTSVLWNATHSQEDPIQVLFILDKTSNSNLASYSLQPGFTVYWPSEGQYARIVSSEEEIQGPPYVSKIQLWVSRDQIESLWINNIRLSDLQQNEGVRIDDIVGYQIRFTFDVAEFQDGITLTSG